MVYTDNWITREERKNKTLIKRSDKELFCKELAFELYISDSDSLSNKDFPMTIKKYFKDVKRIEDIDYFTHDIQSCSFLTSDRTGDFKFIHKSFMEYFVADRVISKLIASFKRKGNVKPIREVNAILGSTYLSMEICLFINDMLDSVKSDIIKRTIALFDYVNDVAKSNILSILAKTGTNMALFLLEHNISNKNISHVDFSNAKFEGCKIQNLSFENVQFYSTTFEKIIFVNCNFAGVVFDKSSLEGAEFYKCQFYISKWRETNLKGCIFDAEYLEDYYIEDNNLDIVETRCSFENSIWSKTSITNCSFNGCDLVDNQMRFMTMQDSKFEFCDFAGTAVIGDLDYQNNILENVYSIPYEFP